MTEHSLAQDMGYPERDRVYGNSASCGPHKLSTPVGDVYLSMRDSQSIYVSDWAFGQPHCSLDGKRQISFHGILSIDGTEWLSILVTSKRFISYLSKKEQQRVAELIRLKAASWLQENSEVMRQAQQDALRGKAQAISDTAVKARQQAQIELNRAERLDQHAAQVLAELDTLEQQR